MGALVAIRRPDNRVGWLILAAGVAFNLWVFAHRYAVCGLVVRPDPLPAAPGIAWLSPWVGAVGFGLASTLLLQLLPDGDVLTRRWCAMVVSGVVGVLIVVLT